MSPVWVRVTFPLWFPCLLVYVGVRAGWEMTRETWREVADA